ncbi:MAG: hypothetical protein JSS02_23105 [Planctomycetes bacterium]|nr:hypothetical protein [Planctomycetota bacterium]
MNTAHTGNSQVDTARQLLCQQFAHSLNGEKFTVRVRISEPAGQPPTALFTAHDGLGWHKAGETVIEPILVDALKETLDMLASTPHHDAWSVRHETHADAQETEIRFHREQLAEHVGPKLESQLMGLLFRDQHDSSKDMRRNMGAHR